jgi:hypothetical protein
MKIKVNSSKARVSCSFAILVVFVLIAFVHFPVPAFGEEGAVVEVDTVEELYAEFYNPNNVGATIELAPGTYVLNASGPNGGRLVFGPTTAVAIQGQNEYLDIDGDGVPDPRDDNGDGEPDLDPAGNKIFADPATETIIDASGLILSANTAFIELRAQPNTSGTSQSVSNITLRGNATPEAAIFVRGIQKSILDAKIAGCIIEDSQRGVDIDARLMNPAGQNAQLNVMVEGNVIRNNNIAGFLPGWGMQTIQANTSGVKFFVNVLHNRFYQNKVCLFITTTGMQDGVTKVISHSNVYEETVLTSDPTLVHVFSAGIYIVAGDSFNRTISSYRNGIKLVSTHDAIVNNEGWAGVYVEGIRRNRNGTEIKDNEIEIELLGTRFVKLNEDGTFDGLQNREARVDPGKTEEEQPMLRRDITIVGANNSGTNLREPPPGGFTGPTIDNKVKVKVKEATTSLMPTDYDQNPQPFVVFDNALPDEVEVEFELEEINYLGL